MKADYECYSNYFVNKDNVRSYDKIVRYSILKQDKLDLFMKHLFDNEEMVLCVEKCNTLQTIVRTLRNNIKMHSQDDFRRVFQGINSSINLQAVSKEEVLRCCWTGLLTIVPKPFFDINYNNKLFRNIVHRLIYSMKGEHINLNVIIAKWNLQTSLWNNIAEGMKITILSKIIKWIIKYLFSAMLVLNFYITTCKLDSDERKLFFFHKRHWQSFYYMSVSKLIVTKMIVKSHKHSAGKVIRKRLSHTENMERKRFKRTIPKLTLILKNNNNFRPIVQYRKDTISKHDKYKVKGYQHFLRKLAGIQNIKMEDLFRDFYQKWAIEKPKLYFIKADLSNAFGSIRRLLLMKILCETYARVLKQETDFGIKKQLAQQYKDLITEFRRPILVRCGSTVYEWNEGLVQGYRYSPALSEIYYNYLDKKYFSELINNNGLKFFIRIVDDYLFITDSLDVAYEFLNALSNYRNVNYGKTVVNFDYPNVKFSNNITFLGYSYDTINLQVSRASNIYSGHMCYKIAFSNAVTDLDKFLRSRIGQSSIPINNHLFNFIYNNEELVWKHIFTTFCLSANKFCTILAVICEENCMDKYINLYKKITVKLCNSIIENLNRSAPNNFQFYYCINHFRYLSFKALLLCSQKTAKCNHLVPQINVHLAKCDCIFRKWREHASSIDIHGVTQRKAIRDICKKHEFKNVVKHFDKLPDGFQCYNKYSRK